MSVLDCTCIFHRYGAESQGDIIHSCFQIENVKNTNIILIEQSLNEISNYGMGEMKEFAS